MRGLLPWCIGRGSTLSCMSKQSPEPFSAVILAGGFGTRLGQEKARAICAGRPLLHWTAAVLVPLSDDLVVVRRQDQTLPPSDEIRWREAVDLRSERGPLAGIEAALSAARHDLAVMVACDMPLLAPDLVRAIVVAAEGVDVVMPVLDGREQPLPAAYRKSCLPVVEETLAAGEGRIVAILPRLRVRRLERADLVSYDETLASFTNVNYPEDLERVAAALARRAVAGKRP